MRRFLNRRTLLIASGVLLLSAVSAIVGLYVFVNSPAFNERVRKLIVERTGAYSGAEVSLERVRWSLRQQRLVLENLRLQGTEAPNEPPLARIESITAGINLRSLLQKRIDLFELTLVNPEFHLHVDSQGRTNLPGPAKREAIPETQLTLSIDNLKVIGGHGIINNRQVDIDFAVTKLVSDLRYRSDTQILSAQVSYAGTLSRPGEAAIPYEMSTDFDFTRGSVIAQRIRVTSNKSSITLQGRIDKVLTPESTGKLAYTAIVQTQFLKQFLPKDTFDGRATATGTLQFSPGTLSTAGEVASEALELDGWKAGTVKAKYSYHYPRNQLTLTNMSAKVLGGNAKGKITVDSLWENPRFSVNLDYEGIDAALLAHVYPWDSKYVIYSRAEGQLTGSFTGRLANFEFEGRAHLFSYPPPSVPSVVALPANGNLSFALRPSETHVRSSDIQFLDTSIQAQGQIQKEQLDLTVNVASSNLSNLDFLYPKANGKGTFKGTVQGPFQQPTLDGAVTLDGHKYEQWTIQHAEGAAKLDMQTESAELRDINVTIGQSRAIINGTARLDGSVVNLRIRSDEVHAQDFESIMKEKIGGILAGNVTVTSLRPLKVEGHVKGSGLVARGRTFQAIEGDVAYNDPTVDIRNLTVSERGARLTGGTLRYDRVTGALQAEADVTSVSLDQAREFGIPETLQGTLQRAHIEVTGTLERPRIEGNAVIENLSVRGESFPRARLAMTTNWPYLNVDVTETGNVTLSARVDISSANYPFEATAKFQDYSIEKLANFNQGTLTASGEAKLKGQLTGQARFSGSGTIRALRAQLQGYPFTAAKPFVFSFDENKLTLSDEAAFNGEYGTRMALKGSIGLADSPTLDLTVKGNLDLSEIAAASESWSITGTVTVDGQVRGTSSNPNISGIANIANASLGREGVYTTVTALNGDVRFNENRVTFDNLAGRVGGGTVRIRGTGLIQNSQMEALNIRLEADQVRLRYPEGLRSLVTGTLLLGGTSKDPLLYGNLTVDSMSYRSDFEPFLAIFRPGGLDSGGTPLDRLQLSIHVVGNRNISVQNELTDITSVRLDLDIKGTVGSPRLTGHVEVTEGILLFQGKRYEITRGNIDFVDPLKIDPVVDLQAETDLRDYRVILAITGRGSNLRVELRSDPPLPQLDLISLIAGGKTREELEQESADRAAQSNTPLPTSEQLFQGGAASILTDMLRSSLGSRFGLMGLDFIRIDPYFETTNPSFRVTLSQRVSKDLAVTYSQDLASNEQRLILIEYYLSKNLSIVASREENNEISALGLDVKLRKRF